METTVLGEGEDISPEHASLAWAGEEDEGNDGRASARGRKGVVGRVLEILEDIIENFEIFETRLVRTMSCAN